MGTLSTTPEFIVSDEIAQRIPYSQNQLRRLEAQGFKVRAHDAEGPWQDGRPHAKLALHAALTWATVRNAY